MTVGSGRSLQPPVVPVNKAPLGLPGPRDLRDLRVRKELLGRRARKVRQELPGQRGPQVAMVRWDRSEQPAQQDLRVRKATRAHKGPAADWSARRHPTSFWSPPPTAHKPANRATCTTVTGQ